MLSALRVTHVETQSCSYEYTKGFPEVWISNFSFKHSGYQCWFQVNQLRDQLGKSYYWHLVLVASSNHTVTVCQLEALFIQAGCVWKKKGYSNVTFSETVIQVERVCVNLSYILLLFSDKIPLGEKLNATAVWGHRGFLVYGSISVQVLWNKELHFMSPEFN